MNDVRVAVGICTYHRPQSLRRLLGSLAHIELGQLAAENVCLFVVDNDPQLENAEICRVAADQLSITLQYVEETRAGVTNARNTVVEKALDWGADFLSFIDDDDIPRPNWLQQLLYKQSVADADLVFGSWRAAKDTPEWAVRAGIFRDPTRNKAIGGAGRYGLPICASTCNVLASRQILEKLTAIGDVFDHRFRFSGGEDKDFFIRARQQGAVLASADDSIINLSYEAERFQARGLLRRGFKGGCSQAGMARVYGNPGKIAQIVVKAGFKLILVGLSLPLTLVHKPLFLHHVYRLGKSAGVLYSLTTQRAINYYAKGGGP